MKYILIIILAMSTYGCSTIRCSSPTVIERTTDIGSDDHVQSAERQ